jgi:methyl-accepting chemotaxis protein
MSIEDNIAEIVSSIDHLADQINPTNDFGNTVGDEVAGINQNLSRVADALEQILKIMRTVK